MLQGTRAISRLPNVRLQSRPLERGLHFRLLSEWNCGESIGQIYSIRHFLHSNQLFRKAPFFHGHDNTDQLVKIAKVLGTDDLYLYLEKYDMDLPVEYDDVMRK